MALLLPDAAEERITDITPELLRAMGVKALILDADNTLSGHASQTPFEGAVEWVERMKGEGFSAIVVSNNFKKRVAPFAAKFSLPFIAMALKPLPFGYIRAMKRMKSKRKTTAAIGDQVFTDILGARLTGLRSILLTPQGEESILRFGWRRRMEAPIRRKIQEKQIGKQWKKSR